MPYSDHCFRLAHKIATKAIPSATGIQFWKWTPQIENSSVSHCPTSSLIGLFLKFPKETRHEVRRLRLSYCQKWMMRSLAAITAQLRVGGIPALALPLKAFAFSER